jgi:zinc protease
VLDEYRLRMKSAAGRVSEACWKLLMRGCKYADRNIIGTEETIKGVTGEGIRAFYERWYHPGLMVSASFFILELFIFY